MCMKNVNASIMFCSEMEANNDEIKSLIGIYDGVVPARENNSYYLDNFNVILNCSIIFEEQNRGRRDCLQLGEIYEYMVWLAHVESGLGIPLYRFELQINQENLRTWCKDFYEFKRFLNFQRIDIPKGLGNYAVKLLIRKKDDSNETPWNSQVIQSLIIGESR